MYIYIYIYISVPLVLFLWWNPLLIHISIKEKQNNLGGKVGHGYSDLREVKGKVTRHPFLFLLEKVGNSMCMPHVM
jgi:hypothetical protein